MNKIRKGDQVIVITGKDKGKRGIVEQVLPREERIVVEGINIAKRHVKANQRQSISSGIIDKTMPLHISNVAIYNHATHKADRVGFRFLSNGQKVRYFKSTNEVIDK